MRWWNRFIRNYFTFTSGQRNAILILVGIIFILIIFPWIYPNFKHDEGNDFSEFRREIDSFRSQANSLSDSSDAPSISELDREEKPSEKIASKSELFAFDPNTATEENFRQLGLNDRLIKTILNYRSKGGKFFETNDLKKIYGLKDEDFQRLKPYIQISSEGQKSAAQFQNQISKPERDRKFDLLDINKADSIDLVALPGIGAVLSSRIIKYRDKLGGFYSTEQLKEVYGLAPETFDEIKPKIQVDSNEISRIKINEASLEELKRHPYFKTVAVPLLNYREQHGAFKILEDLKNVDVITDDVFQKISHYVEL